MKRGPFQKEKSLPVPSCFSKLHHSPKLFGNAIFSPKKKPKEKKNSAKTSPNSRHWAPVTTYFPLGMTQGAILASARWERPKFWSTCITCRLGDGWSGKVAESKNFPTYPWNIPQTPNQRFMKEFLSVRGLGIPGVCSEGMLGFS